MTSKKRQRHQTRHQPPRKCKQLPKADWLALPEDVLLDILEWSAPPGKGRFGRAGWKWYAQITGSCKTFRTLSDRLVPKEVRLDLSQEGNVEGRSLDALASLDVGLLRSFVDCMGRGHALTSVVIASPMSVLRHCDRSDLGFEFNQEFFNAVRLLLTTPGILPNVTSVSVSFEDFQIYNREVGLVQTNFLRDVARALPRLQSLSLVKCGSSRDDLWVGPGEMAEFGQNARQLRNLELLDAVWLGDAHLQALCPHLAPLVSLKLTGANNICSDLAMQHIARSCCDLMKLSFHSGAVTTTGVESVLRGCTNLTELDLTGCHGISSAISSTLVEHGSHLTHLGAGHCQWLTDRCLNALIDSQITRIGHSAGRSIALRSLAVDPDVVTPGGLRRALDKAPGVLGVPNGEGEGQRGYIDIGWVNVSPENLAELEDDLSIFEENTVDDDHQQGLRVLIEEFSRAQAMWLPLVNDFPHVHFV